MRNNSLDYVRGFAIFLMTLVNFPGSWSSLFPYLKHASPTGFTLADLVFPIFLWTVGYSIQLSHVRRGSQPSREYLIHVTKRTFLLIFAGLFLALFPTFSFSTFRIPGVLQRIAVCYFIFTLFLRTLSFQRAFLLTISLGFCLAVANRFFALKNSMLELSLSVPSMDQTLGATLDRFVFGIHIWKESKVFDPEGILTTLIAMMSVALGSYAFKRNQTLPSYSERLSFVISYLFLGFALSFVFPVSKDNWSPSFVFIGTGIVEAIFLFFQSIEKIPQAKIARVSFNFLFGEIGKHALLYFFLMGLLARTTLYSSMRQMIFGFLKGVTGNPFWTSFLFSLLLYVFVISLVSILKSLRDQISKRFILK